MAYTEHSASDADDDVYPGVQSGRRIPAVKTGRRPINYEGAICGVCNSDEHYRIHHGLSHCKCCYNAVTRRENHMPTDYKAASRTEAVMATQSQRLAKIQPWRSDSQMTLADAKSLLNAELQDLLLLPGSAPKSVGKLRICC